MAKMRTRRTSLIKARDPLFEDCERGAEARHVRRKLRELGAAHEHPALVYHIVGERFASAQDSIALPSHQRARAVANALRRYVAEHARQFFLDVRAQVPRHV